jgi:hypothetical protein
MPQFRQNVHCVLYYIVYKYSEENLTFSAKDDFLTTKVEK